MTLQLQEAPEVHLAATIVLILLCLYTIYCIGKRRFQRRNIAGIEEFKSYWQATFTPIIESIISIAATGAILMLGTYVVMILIIWK